MKRQRALVGVQSGASAVPLGYCPNSGTIQELDFMNFFLAHSPEVQDSRGLGGTEAQGRGSLGQGPPSLQGTGDEVPAGVSEVGRGVAIPLPVLRQQGPELPFSRTGPLNRL
jgi:hypothetical protein